MRLIGLTVILAIGLLATPLAAEAQQAGRVYRLGILSAAAPPAPSTATAVFLVPVALRELGYVEGQNLVIERRFAEGKLDRLPGLAQELVQLRVDVIFAVSQPAVQAAKDATKTVPIVMIATSDPVRHGFVASLARPGGNVTGVVLVETGLIAKRLELLKNAVPRATRIAVLSTDEPHVRDQAQEAQKAASSLGVMVVVIEVVGNDYESAFTKMVADRARALLVPVSVILNVRNKRIIELAAKHRLPAIYFWRDHAEEGGLMAYGTSISARSRRAASYVDRIFKGASPSELPVEQPTTYELTVNLKTAKALGLTIPPSVLLQADQVIE
jgi:putative ABC transport system substrate-binding protein